MSSNPRSMAPRKRDEEGALAASTGLEVEKVHHFVEKFGDSLYINAQGRRWKMDERFGAGGYSISVSPPSQEEYGFLTRMMGVGDGSPCIIMKASITVAGKKLSEDYGFLTPLSCRGGEKQFRNDGLHIATTKAINRAMGQLVAGGFADGDNTYEQRGEMEIVAPEKPIGSVTHVNPRTGHEGYVPETGSPQVTFLGQCRDLKKAIVERHGSEEPYYRLLRSHGFEKSNDPALCTNGEMMQSVLKGLSELARGPIPVHPDPEPPLEGSDREEAYVDPEDAFELILDESIAKDERTQILSCLLDDVCAHPALREIRNEKTLSQHLIDKVTPLMEDEKDFEEAIAKIRKAVAMCEEHDARQVGVFE